MYSQRSGKNRTCWRTSWDLLCHLQLSCLIAGVFAAPACATDLFATMDDVLQSLVVFDSCHIALPVFITQAEGQRKVAALGQATYQQILSGLKSPTEEATQRQADFLLKTRTEHDLQQAHARIKDQGCDALVPQAQASLERFQLSN